MSSNDSQFKVRITKLLSFLGLPVSIGVYLTFILSGFAFYYYQARQNPQKLKGAFKIVNDIDQKSIDYRLLLRGQRPADSRVAVLAVDDRSISQVGRWPWPREKLAAGLAEAFENGAKVIAADVVWSEPTDRPELRFAQKLSQSVRLPEAEVENILNETHSDRIFSDFIKKYKNQFVLGNFFESPYLAHENPLPLKATPCIDTVFQQSALHKMHESQERPLIIADDREINIPNQILETYIEFLSDKNNTPPLTIENKFQFCGDAFFNLDKDDVAQQLSSNWETLSQEIFSNQPPAQSFEEWNQYLETNTLRNAVPETLFWTLNIPQITESGVHHGYFNAKQDADGTIRRSQLIARTGSRYIPSISLLAYLIDQNANAEIDIRQLPKNLSLRGIESFKINNEDGDMIGKIPVTSDGYLMINYAGRGHTIPHASLADLLDKEKTTVLVTQMKKDSDGVWIRTEEAINKKTFFKDKILILGATAIAVFDLRVTPFDENFPGVETHANVVDNLLRKDFLYYHPDEDLKMPLAMLGLGTALTLTISYSGALLGLLLSLLCALAVTLIDRYFLFSQGILVSVAFPLLQTLLTYMGLTFYKYLTEERSKKELRQTFSKYVSPQIVEEILRDPKNLELGGRKTKLTVFFSDVRGFTTISEKLDPRELSDLLNSYLTPMTDLVFKNKGTLDKYMGDAIMAFFGAPLPMEDHAKWACRCALQHIEKLNELKKIYSEKGLPEIDIGIGLNTGECSVGNMGSQTVRSYTVMGDTVNLASRLEGINKQYGTRIIISEFTQNEISSSFTTREIDRVKVKGKNKPVRIFELICEGDASGPQKSALLAFRVGYDLYLKKDFSGALNSFKEAQQVHDEEVTRLYISRCEDYMAAPPPPDWDGVYEMKTK